MIFTFSLRQLLKNAYVFVIIILLLIGIFYLFPILLKLFGQNQEEKMRQQYLLEKPLRVLQNLTGST
jgi:uncharacterized alpha/beta hydrolase family protein